MLEIIALILLTRDIGILARKKGQRPGQWKLYTVVSWLGSEIGGIIIGLVLWGRRDLIAIAVLGFSCAIASYIILRTNLSKRPDVYDDIDQLGNDVKNQ